MIRIVRSLDRFDGRSAFGTWAYRIATNASLDELRRRNRRPALHVVQDGDEDLAREPVDDLAHRRVEAVADRMAIDAALADLPEDFRVPVVMRDVGDLDYAEIATELGVPIGTVKSRIARGRKMLLERLGNHGHPTNVQREQPLPRRTIPLHGAHATTPRPVNDDDLSELILRASAYLDGELDAAETDRAEADPAVMAEVEQLRALQADVRRRSPTTVATRDGSDGRTRRVRLAPRPGRSCPRGSCRSGLALRTPAGSPPRQPSWPSACSAS